MFVSCVSLSVSCVTLEHVVFRLVESCLVNSLFIFAYSLFIFVNSLLNVLHIICLSLSFPQAANCLYVIFSASGQTALTLSSPQASKLPLCYLLRKRSNCLSPFRGDGRGVVNVQPCSLEITDPLYLPLKRGGPVCLPLESPRRVLLMYSKTLSINLFRKRQTAFMLSSPQAVKLPLPL